MPVRNLAIIPDLPASTMPPSPCGQYRSLRPQHGAKWGKGSSPELAEQLAALPHKEPAELRVEWRRLYRAEPPGKIGRDVLELGIAFKLQERALGGLGSTERRRLAELSRQLEETGGLSRSRTVTVRPGARLIREWRGQVHEVLVQGDGSFLWNGKAYRSLSVIAREITGTRWSGPRFFGLLTGSTRKTGAAAYVPAPSIAPEAAVLHEREPADA